MARLGAGLLVVHLDGAEAEQLGGASVSVMGEPTIVSEALARQMSAAPLDRLLPLLSGVGLTWINRRMET